MNDTVTIALLHTAESNAALFEAARPPGVALRHQVRTDLLDAAAAAGGMDAAIEAETARVLTTMADGADAVLLTCSTLGPAAARVGAAVPVLRVDAALAEAAARAPGPVIVLVAAETTLKPTSALFAAAAPDGAAPEVRLVPDAWAAFRAGDDDRYLDMIAAAADAAFAAGAGTVVLAQASMAGAAERCRRGMPLASPGVGLRAAAEAARTLHMNAMS